MLPQRKSERMDFYDTEHYETKAEEDRREFAFFEGMLIGILLSIPAWIIICGLIVYFVRR